jgi:hypothetical protein
MLNVVDRVLIEAAMVRVKHVCEDIGRMNGVKCPTGWDTTEARIEADQALQLLSEIIHADDRIKRQNIERGPVKP